MRKFIASALAAGVLLAATAGSALMAALPTVGASCSADNGLVLVSFIYDASQNPPPITEVTVVNNDTQTVTVGATFLKYSDFSVVWSGARPFAPGTTHLNVAGLNQHMMSVTNKFGTFWAFPFAVSCSG